MKKLSWIVLVLLSLSFGCRTPFDPEVPSKETSILVVEGYLDTEGLRSELKLSRTVPLDSQTTFAPEIDASIRLISSTGESQDLLEEKPGLYVFKADVLETNTYTLEIILNNGNRFQSDPIRPIVTPDILDAGFLRDEDGVEVFVTTQGNENADDFLWTFEESWIYRPKIRTSYIYDPSIDDVRERTEQEQIALCYKSESSPDILLETSSRFQEQVVFRQTITEIPTGDERIMERYSILVSQKGIEQDAVKFWEILKKNTEDIGSIFSPLPSLIGGNIHSMDDENIPVVGQVSMGVVKEKRIYINQVDVIPWGYNDPQFNDCYIDQDLINIVDYDPIFVSGNILPVRAFVPPGGTRVIGYYPSTRRCVDCTLYANQGKPDFWEDE